jgi:hypothetical protein
VAGNAVLTLARADHTDWRRRGTTQKRNWYQAMRPV